MNTEKIKQFEDLLGRHLEKEEVTRLTRIKETLELRDDDALWDILVALEYHHDYCEKLPEKMLSISNEIDLGIADVIHKELSKAHDIALKNSCSSIFGDKSGLLIGLSVLLVLLLFYGAGSMWAGYSLGTRQLHSPLAILVMPVGYVMGLLFLPASVYCGKQGAVAFSDGQKKMGTRYTAAALLFFISGVMLFALSC